MHSGKPAEPPPPDAGYCIKGWGASAAPTHSYLSQTRCGGGVAARTVNGSCNRPSARYTMCPNGAGTTQVTAVLQHKSAEQVRAACEADSSCVGFTLSGGSAQLLR